MASESQSAPPVQSPPPAGEVRTTVHAYELLQAVDFFAPIIRAITIDCFDTLLWRSVAAPTDVFFDLVRHPVAAAINMTGFDRVTAEISARQLASLRSQTIEVTLAEIYAEENLQVELSAEQREQLIEAELVAEEKTCFAFPPFVELIRAAKAKNLQIYIVSDTYLREAQLRRLLGKALPAGVLELVDGIFCSNEYRRGKPAGLFQDVLAKTGLKPSDLLHIGDNLTSDFDAPRAAQIQALHFVQQEHYVEQILRMQGLAYSMQHGAIRGSEALESPFRGVLASQPQPPDPARVLGYVGAGPLLYSFGRYILDELEQLRAAGKKVKPLFLLRDAFLPQQVCNALAGEPVGAAVSISRFAAQAAAFRTLHDVDEYLVRNTKHNRFDAMSRQLLLPAQMAKEIIRKAERHEKPNNEFMRQVRKPEVLKTIFARSKQHRDRLFLHINARLPIERGDTVVLVDLGYVGTVQKILEPIFREELGIEMVGRYMIAAPTQGWTRSRKGLIDADMVDYRAIAVLLRNHNVALVEDICTTDMVSVTLYDEKGDPVQEGNSISSAQHSRIATIQRHCLDFCADAEAFFRRIGRFPSRAMLRASALGAVTRMLFFPSELEVECLESFRIDLNLGTNDTFQLFNRERGLKGLQRRGLFSVEKTAEMRTNYPIELRSASLTLALTLLATGRFSLEFTQHDLTLRREKLKVLFLRADGSSSKEIDAVATYDGYFALVVPFGDGSLNLGIVFGSKYSWVQIESVQAIRTDYVYSESESMFAKDIFGQIQHDGMVQRAPGIFECTSPAAFLVPLPPKLSEMPKLQGESAARSMVCRIVFRPLVRREATAPAA